jgi:hypothetical protein
VLKFYANRISGASDPTYDFQFGGDEPLRTLVPIPLSVLPSQIPTLQQVVEEGRTFAETDTSTDYSLELFGGTGALKRLYASIVNSANTSIFSFVRNAFTLRTFSSTNNSSEISTSGSGVTLKHTSSVNTQTLRVVQNPTAPASTEFRTPAISDSSTYFLAVMPRVTTSDIMASAGVEYNASSVSNITFADPSTGSVSFLEVGYKVFAFRGTVTVGGVVYPQGTYLLRQRNSSTTLWETTILDANYTIITANTTAVNDRRYTANGTLTVTDPTPIANKGYIVHVIGGTSTIGGVGYTTGALVYRYYDGSSWISTNMNNAITIDATPTDGSSNAVSSNGVFDALATKLNIEAAATTGVVISFTNDRVYGTIASPETGNITADVTGGLLGVTNIIIHNAGSAPTFGAEFKKLSGSGNYVTSVVNYIYCTYITSTEIIYSINQRT